MENYTGEYVLIGHNVNHFQSLYFISQPPWQSSSMPSHFGFDKARKLHATSEIPNKRTKLSMKKHDAIMSVLSSKENISKDIKTDKVEMEIQQKCLQQVVYYIEGKKEENKYECRKRRKQLRSKIKSTQSVESKLNYANNTFNMELDILIAILIRKKDNILENPENTGEEFKMQNSYAFSACGRETTLAIEMQETPQDARDLVGLQ